MSWFEDAVHTASGWAEELLPHRKACPPGRVVRGLENTLRLEWGCSGGGGELIHSQCQDLEVSRHTGCTEVPDWAGAATVWRALPRRLHSSWLLLAGHQPPALKAGQPTGLREGVSCHRFRCCLNRKQLNVWDHHRDSLIYLLISWWKLSTWILSWNNRCWRCRWSSRF